MSRNKRISAANDVYETWPGISRSNNINRVTLIERMYMRILSELATNRFKWTGLPETVDIRYLETTLFSNALSVFYEDKDYGFLALRASAAAGLNMVNNPLAFMVYGNQFINKTISAKNCVPIWANYLRMPDLDIVTVYAHKFAQLDITIEINSANARQSKVLISPENLTLSTQNINRQYVEGNNNIQVSGIVGDMAFMTAVDLGINPDSIEKLHILKARLWNECMGLLGIDNANQDKKERLVADEIDANQDQTSMMRFVNLNARRTAADLIKKKYGHDVKVEYYTDAQRYEEMMLEAGIEQIIKGNDSEVES